MKHYQLHKRQHGLALLAAVLIVTIFTILGMMSAQKAREDEKITGGTVRYSTVFEAAEQSLRDAASYIKKIKGLPLVGDGSGGRDLAKNFPNRLSAETVESLISDPSKTIVWSKETLEHAFCGDNGCTGGLNFVDHLDKAIWQTKGILSTFNDNDTTASDNYINNTQTYTFIEELQSADSTGKGKYGDSRMIPESAKSGSGGQDTVFYLITVKASGFPPGIKDEEKTAANARENVMLQAVFARR